MRSALSLLTKLPLKAPTLERAAKQAYLFPAVGLVIGAILYLVGIISFTFLPDGVGALLVVLVLYLITGLLHLDGLSDLSDGIMSHGTIKQKISAMKDVNIGIGGVFSVVFVLIATIYSIYALGSAQTSRTILGYTLPMYQFGVAIILSEVSAKLGMNTCVAMGKKLPGGGMGQTFIKHSTLPRYLAAVLLATVIGVVLTGMHFVVVYAGIIVALFMVRLAHRHFGGINGDVIGSVNEVARVVTLLVWVVIL